MNLRSQSEKISFPNLNGIRFIAAAMVLFDHAELTVLELKHPEYWSKRWLDYLGKFFDTWLGFMGGLGVSLFFTLSGFLITYLLLSEKKKSTDISIKKFYVRRILRIWPVYYLLIITGLFILPHISFLKLPGTENIHQDLMNKSLLFFLIFPNIVLLIWGRVPFISQTWSIGVEEQFYLVWPWFVKKIKSISLLLLICITVYIFSIYEQIAFPKFSKSVNFGCISMGSIGGLLLFSKNRQFLKIAHSHLTFLLTVACVLAIFIWPNGVLRKQEIFAFFFMLIIVYLASAPKTLISLNSKWLDYLGKISYGIYMYHYIPIVIAIRIAEQMGWFKPLYMSLFVCGFTFPVTILMAHFSYKYYEKWFLGRKKKFEVVESGG